MGKCMESLFGYISVLPGAFSAYRYKAIKGQPLQRYFYSIKNKLSPFKANMYLAEDRILCFELLVKQGCNWILYYVKDAPAVTDVPENIASLIKQRRRWLNGSFFSQLYAMSHFGRIWSESNHSFGRKLCITFEFFYFFISTIFTWFNVGSYYIGIRLVFNGVMSTPTIYFDPQNAYNILGTPWTIILINLLEFIWVFLLVIQLIISLRNKPEDIVCLQTFCCIVFGIINYFIIFLIIYWLYFITIPLWLEITTLSIFAAPIIASIIHLEFIPIILSILQYYFMLPTYINVFVIYSLSNTHDVSWGTKGIETEHVPNIKNISTKDLIKKEKEQNLFIEKQKKESDQREGKFKRYRSHLLIFWMLCNILWVAGISMLDNNIQIYSIILFFGAGFQTSFLFLFSILFAIKFYITKLWFGLIYCFTCACCRKQEIETSTREEKKIEYILQQKRKKLSEIV